MLRSAPALLAILLFGAATPATAVTIDFEEFAHGDIVAAPVASHARYTLVAENFHRTFDAAVAFDTSQTGTVDPDLERGGSFATGNIANHVLGNVLILQEHDTTCHGRVVPPRCSEPDDEGGRPAGKFTFLLDEVATGGFSFDLVDVDGETSENGRITFFLLEDGSVNVTVASYSFAQFLDFGQGVAFGDRSANHIDFNDLGPFNALEIVMGGSGGIDNIFANGVPVPEPTTGVLLVLGLTGVTTYTRRRS